MHSRAELVSYAIRLSYVTIGWNALVGAATLVSALLANSLSLGGFALNMLLDTSASAVLVWRFKKEERDPVGAHRLEQHAQTGIALPWAGSCSISRSRLFARSATAHTLGRPSLGSLSQSRRWRFFPGSPAGSSWSRTRSTVGRSAGTPS